MKSKGPSSLVTLLLVNKVSVFSNVKPVQSPFIFYVPSHASKFSINGDVSTLPCWATSRAWSMRAWNFSINMSELVRVSQRGPPCWVRWSLSFLLSLITLLLYNTYCTKLDALPLQRYLIVLCETYTLYMSLSMPVNFLLVGSFQRYHHGLLVTSTSEQQMAGWSVSVNVGAMCAGHSFCPYTVVTGDMDLFVSELVEVSHCDLDLQWVTSWKNFCVTWYSHCYWSDIRYPFVIRYPIVLKCTDC